MERRVFLEICLTLGALGAAAHLCPALGRDIPQMNVVHQKKTEGKE